MALCVGFRNMSLVLQELLMGCPVKWYQLDVAVVGLHISQGLRMLRKHQGTRDRSRGNGILPYSKTRPFSIANLLSRI